MERNYGVECYIYGICWAWSSVNPVMLVHSGRKHLPDLEDDLQGFPNEENRKFKILTQCALSNIEEWLQSDVCELGFQHDRQTDIVNAATKQKREEEGGKDESEIHTAMRTGVNSSQKQVIITDCFLK
jgi:hypothetical protein